MNYDFPIINDIYEVLEAIAGRDEFVVAYRDGYTIIDYAVNFEDTFPPVKVAGGSAKMRAYRTRNYALRRECRGIIFDSETGKIIRRPYHKFFNMDERQETQNHLLPMSQPHVILEKLDGSMISPFAVRGELIWGTKMGDTDVAKLAQAFIADKPEYEDFAWRMIDNGITPIFEFCSRDQRIVIDYPETQLVLTALRGMTTGDYYPFEDFVLDDEAIPTVESVGPSGMTAQEIAEWVAPWRTDSEGVVIRFDTGHMVKVKCDWYCRLHKTKDKMRFERHIVEMILDKSIDDLKPHLSDEDKKRLAQFEMRLHQEIHDTCLFINGLTDSIYFKGYDKKHVAMEIAPTIKAPLRSIVFKMMDHHSDDGGSFNDVRDEFLKVLNSHLSSNVKYEEFKETLNWTVKF